MKCAIIAVVSIVFGINLIVSGLPIDTKVDTKNETIPQSLLESVDNETIEHNGTHKEL